MMTLESHARLAGGSPRGQIDGSVHLPELILYERIDFGGESCRTNLGHCAAGEAWKHGIGSFIVVCGVWAFYELPDFGGQTLQLGPGYYRCAREAGLPNNQIASYRPVAF